MSTHTAPAAEDSAYPPELAALEDALVRRRRQACGLPPDGPRIGFGLSGGGIRSATFCLGIFQALARKRDGGELLARIDFLSTVSGGGYFGSFLGALFTRAHVRNVADAAAVLRGDEHPAKGQTTFRFLRDNGRYLAPRGSGDLLALITVTLRNWLAVQTVLVLAVLAAFVALQYADQRLQPVFAALYGAAAALPTRLVVHSPWFVWLLPLVALWALPSAWAYWVIALPLSKRQLFRRTDVVVLALIALAWGAGWIPPRSPDGAWPPSTIAMAAFAVVALATVVWSLLANPRGIFNWLLGLLRLIDMQRAVADASLARNRLTRWSKRALVAIVVVAVVAGVDSLGATAYALFSAGGFTKLTTALAGVLATFGGVAAFGRQLLVFLGGEGRGKRVRVPLSLVSWAVAVLVLGAWLVTLNAVSHAVAWQGAKPPYADALFAAAPVRITDANALVLTAEGDGRQTLRPIQQQQQSVATTPATTVRSPVFTGRVLLLLFLFVLAIGSVRTLLNASSLHAFYAQRLARAYLGASNRERLDNDAAHVTEVIRGDDVPSDRYWNWPRPKRTRGHTDARARVLRRRRARRALAVHARAARFRGSAGRGRTRQRR